MVDTEPRQLNAVFPGLDGELTRATPPQSRDASI